MKGCYLKFRSTFKELKHYIKICNYEHTDWEITDYLSHSFRLKIMDALTRLYFNHNNSPKILEDDSFIMWFDGISLESKNQGYIITTNRKLNVYFDHLIFD